MFDIDAEAVVGQCEQEAPSEHHEPSDDSGADSEPEPIPELMVATRTRRVNAGNRMSTLLAKSAEEEEWGEEWEDAPNEEEYDGVDVNEQDDYNMDSSSSEESDNEADDDDAGEKELRKAERQEKTKKRRLAANPFAIRAAAAAHKRVKIHPPEGRSPNSKPPRPKKKSERSSWIPTDEDGPVRTSLRRATIVNKETTMAKLKAKDRKRDDTLAMMKAAEARKAKAMEKPLTQAERLAEAARNERINRKTLHRWEEAEEARAVERQAKIDALKNRHLTDPFIRYYSGPAIWVDEKLKFVGKDAPSLEQLEDKYNKEPTALLFQHVPDQSGNKEDLEPEEGIVHTAAGGDDNNTSAQELPSHASNPIDSQSGPSSNSIPTAQLTPQQPWTPASAAGDVFMGSHGMPYTSPIMFQPPSQDSLLSGIDQYAYRQPSQATSTELPANPFSLDPHAIPPQSTSQPPFPQHPPPNDPPITHSSVIGPQALLSHFQRPPPPPAPPRKKTIRRALRNLLVLQNFANFDAPHISSRARTPASLIKDRDRAALIQLSMAVFNWSTSDATAYVTAMLASSSFKPTKKNLAAHDAAFAPKKPLCAVTNAIARYRDPETGIAYRDARAFGVVRGVVGGGFVWSGTLGCYVGGRAKPLESMSGAKGFLGMPPAKNVPRRFWDLGEEKMPAQVVRPAAVAGPANDGKEDEMQDKAGQSKPDAAVIAGNGK